MVVGHDWGSNIAAASALLHPEVFRTVGLLSVPYAPPGGPRPTHVFASWPASRSAPGPSRVPRRR